MSLKLEYYLTCWSSSKLPATFVVVVVCLSRLKQFYVVNPDVTFVIFAVSLANVVVVAVVGVSKGKLATQEVSGSG